MMMTVLHHQTLKKGHHLAGTEKEEEPEEEPATGPSAPHSSNMPSFIAFLAQRHFRLRGETPGEGNCFFSWAMKSQLEKAGLGKYGHDELRKYVTILSLDYHHVSS